MKKPVLIAAALVTVALLTWLFISSTKPLPGEKLLQDGRSHLPEGSKIEYKFNPPTSGDHYSSWIIKGFFDEPRADGSLVHSLEHGYTIIWYDCEQKVTWLQVVGTAYAQGMSMTAGSEGSPSAHLSDMPKSFSDGSCDGLKGELRYIYNNFGPHKLIIMPRVGMDHPVIVTAWGRAIKLSGAGGGGTFDREKIKQFIDAYRDAGPEATIEP